MNSKRFFWMIIVAVTGALLVAACAPSPPEAPGAQAEQAEEEHEADDGHSHSPGQHMAGMHNVPEEAAAVPNPIAATDESIEAGKQIFATNCAVCHGESGQGDGPGAAGLETPPANFTEVHVQELSDGALFYIVSHGRPDTPMPAWDNVLSEDQRWQVVNYLRTFKEGEHHEEDGEHHEEESDHHEEAAEHYEEGEHHEEEGDHHEED